MCKPPKKLRRNAAIILTAPALIFLFFCCSAHHDYWFCANGVVTSNGLPLDGVAVTLVIAGIENETSNNEFSHTTTDNQGRFSFQHGLSGRNTPFTLTFVKSGFKTLNVNGTSNCSNVQTVEMVTEAKL